MPTKTLDRPHPKEKRHIVIMKKIDPHRLPRRKYPTYMTERKISEMLPPHGSYTQRFCQPDRMVDIHLYHRAQQGKKIEYEHKSQTEEIFCGHDLSFGDRKCD